MAPTLYPIDALHRLSLGASVHVPLAPNTGDAAVLAHPKYTTMYIIISELNLDNFEGQCRLQPFYV